MGCRHCTGNCSNVPGLPGGTAYGIKRLQYLIAYVCVPCSTEGGWIVALGWHGARLRFVTFLLLIFSYFSHRIFVQHSLRALMCPLVSHGHDWHETRRSRWRLGDGNMEIPSVRPRFNELICLVVWSRAASTTWSAFLRRFKFIKFYIYRRD